MWKYVQFLVGLVNLGLAFWCLYAPYAPRVGPIGNGPNEKVVWFQFSLYLLAALCFIGLAFITFWHEKRRESEND
ncbi:hypothetical protein ACTID9_05905 [Brevibacillus fluminis]|uniref:hypothetical protein n=1 Tax=Brevibacillus fluminis TaxID=511487 RepID=UPI003F89DE24